MGAGEGEDEGGEDAGAVFASYVCGSEYFEFLLGMKWIGEMCS